MLRNDRPEWCEIPTWVTAAAQHAGPLVDVKPQFQSFRPFKQWALSALALWRQAPCESTHSVEVSQGAEPAALTSNRSQW